MLLARRINQIMHGVLVAPWDVPDLPGDMVDTILSLEDLGMYQAGRQKVQEKMTAWRNQHPAYKQVH